MKELNTDAISFIATFLKKQAKQNDQLPMNSTLLPLLKYKNQKIYKPLFEGINTIVCHASTSKERANLLNKWFLATDTDNTQNGMQLKITVPSETVKKNFQNSLYFTVFNSAIVKSRGFNNSILSFKNSYVPFIKPYTMVLTYKFITCAPPLFHIFKHHNINYLESLGLLLYMFSIDPRHDTDYLQGNKIFFITTFIQYIFVSMQIYKILFVHRNFLLISIAAFILIDLHHINKSSLFFNLMHATAQSIKNKSCRPTNISIEVEPAFNA